MSTMRVSCPNCHAAYNVDESFEGRKGRCKHCRATFVVSAAAIRAAESNPQPIREAPCVGSRFTVEEEVSSVWQPGDLILDLYEVQQVFDGGGMGLVYKVHHKAWNLPLAVKAPRAEYFETERDKQNFEREAETWVNLGMHPHVVTCHYVRRFHGIPRVFAEYMNGGSLKEWIDSDRLYTSDPDETLKRILDVSIQFAWGLNYAHERELIHRDVKPANVLMTETGIAKVSDFGLARAGLEHRDRKVGASNDGVTASSGAMTLAYCSPEQAARKLLSHKTDLWSWAVSVLEMFTGGVTWRSGTAARESLEAYLESGGSGDERIPYLPARMAGLLRQCLEQSPSQRPADFNAIVEALKRIYLECCGKEYSRPVPEAGMLLANSVNNRGVSLLDLGIPIAAEKAFAEALLYDPQHPQAVYNKGLLEWRTGRITDQELVRQVQEVSNVHANQWNCRMFLAQIHLEREDCNSASRILQELVKSDPGRRQAKSLLATSKSRLRQSSHCALTMEGHTQTVSRVCLSPDGKLAISGSWDNTLKIWNTLSGNCLRTLQGHSGMVQSIGLSADGQLAVSCSFDQTLRLWNVHSGRCLQTIPVQNLRIQAACLSADGRHILTGSGDNSLRLWDVSSCRILREFEARSSSLPAAGGTDRIAAAQNAVRSMLMNGIASVCFSADGAIALSGGRDYTVRLWDVSTGRQIRMFEGHSNPSVNPLNLPSSPGVGAVLLNADSGLALTGSADMTLRLWNISDGRCLRKIEGHTNSVTSVALSADGRHAFSGSDDGTMRMWDASNGRCLRTFEGHRGTVTSICLSSKGNHILSGGTDTMLRLFRIDRKPTYVAPYELSLIEATEQSLSARHQHKRLIEEARKALDGQNPAMAARHLRNARRQAAYQRVQDVTNLWSRLYVSIPRIKLDGTWTICTFEGHSSSVSSVCLSPDGRYAFSGSDDHTLRMWDLMTGRCVRTFEGHKNYVSSICLSRDGRRALSASCDNSLRLWDVATGSCLRVLEGHTDPATSVCLGPEGRYAISGGYSNSLKNWDLAHWQASPEMRPQGSREDTLLVLWDIETGRRLRTFEGHAATVMSVCLSADGRYALSGGEDRTMRLWRLSNGECRQMFTGHSGSVTSVCLSADGRFALSGSHDCSLRLWNVSDGTCLQVFEGNRNFVYSVCLSSDGRFALSGGGDNTLRYWDVSSGRCLQTSEGHRSRINSVAMSSDGRHALSGSDDQTVKLWFLDWELEDRQPADWDAGAKPYLYSFLTLHWPYATEVRDNLDQSAHAPIRRTKPTWTDDDFQQLVQNLGCAGYGWLRPEGVRRELEKIAAEWQAPPNHNFS